MNIGELLVIATALAVDAATYAFSYGLALRRSRMRAALMLAVVVGGFQAGMPLLGHMGGVGLRFAVASWGPWLGLGIFAALGVSVLYKAWFSGEESAAAASPLGVWGLLLVGLATSMDAFAVGIGLAVGKSHALSTSWLCYIAAVIGIVTFLAALVCFYLSRLLRHLPERWLQTLAGLLLIALGIYQVC